MDHTEVLGLNYLAQNTIGEIASRFGDGRSGGYLHCSNPKRFLLHTLVGSPADEKSSKYMMFSIEKANRLRLNHDDWLSSQSRDVNANRFAGACRGITGEIFSFSGLPEAIDEATTLAWLVGMEKMSFNDALVRIALSPIADVEAFVEIHDIVMLTVSGGRLML